MVAKAFLFSLFMLGLATVMSLLVVGIIKLIYLVIQRNRGGKAAGQPAAPGAGGTESQAKGA